MLLLRIFANYGILPPQFYESTTYTTSHDYHYPPQVLLPVTVSHFLALHANRTGSSSNALFTRSSSSDAQEEEEEEEEAELSSSRSSRSKKASLGRFWDFILSGG